MCELLIRQTKCQIWSLSAKSRTKLIRTYSRSGKITYATDTAYGYGRDRLWTILQILSGAGKHLNLRGTLMLGSGVWQYTITVGTFVNISTRRFCDTVNTGNQNSIVEQVGQKHLYHWNTLNTHDMSARDIVLYTWALAYKARGLWNSHRSNGMVVTSTIPFSSGG